MLCSLLLSFFLRAALSYVHICQAYTTSLGQYNKKKEKDERTLRLDRDYITLNVLNEFKMKELVVIVNVSRFAEIVRPRPDGSDEQETANAAQKANTSTVSAAMRDFFWNHSAPRADALALLKGGSEPSDEPDTPRRTTEFVMTRQRQKAR
jgi:hypothetical protein